MKPAIIKRLLLFFVLAPLFSVAQDSGEQNHFVFNGYLKDMQTFIFEDIKGDWTTANLVHNRLNFKMVRLFVTHRFHRSPKPSVNR